MSRFLGRTIRAALLTALLAGFWTAAPAGAATITPGGPSVTVTTTTAGQNATVSFTGTAGQRVSLDMTSVTIGTSGCCSTKVSIRKPDGTNLVVPTYVGRRGGFIDARKLPVTGTYKIFIDPQDAARGSMTLTLYDVPADASGTLTPGGAAVSVATTVPGQNAILTFAGTAGQRVSLDMSNVTIGTSSCCSTNVSIRKPDGTDLVAPTTVGTVGGFLDARALPVDGTYKVVVNPQSRATGGIDLTLYDVPADVTGTLTLDGASQTFTTTAPGQNVRATFSGTKGNRVSLDVSPTMNTKVWMLNPDGTKLFVDTAIGASGGFFDARALPATGTYTVVVNPQTDETGSVTLALYDVPPDANGPIVPGGAAQTLTTTTPGQNAWLTFSGTAGKRVSMELSGFGPSSCCGAKVWVVNPDGTKLVVDTSFGTSTKFVDTRTLPATGTYKIVLNPQGAVTGSATVTLYDVPADASAPIADAPVTLTTTVAGQNAFATFTGAKNQRVSLKTSGATFTAKVSMLAPDGTKLIFPTMVNNAFFDTEVLPAAGTYKIVVDPVLAETGDMTLTLYDVPADTTGSIAVDGPGVTVSLGTPGQNGKLTFSGSAGDSLTLSLSGVTMNGKVSVLKPDGTALLTPRSFIEGSSYALDLPVNGTYTIVVDPTGESTGDATVTLATPPPV